MSFQEFLLWKIRFSADAAEEEQLNIVENDEYAGESGSENGDEDMQLGENEAEEFETDEVNKLVTFFLKIYYRNRTGPQND